MRELNTRTSGWEMVVEYRHRLPLGGGLFLGVAGMVAAAIYLRASSIEHVVVGGLICLVLAQQGFVKLLHVKRFTVHTNIGHFTYFAFYHLFPVRVEGANEEVRGVAVRNRPIYMRGGTGGPWYEISVFHRRRLALGGSTDLERARQVAAHLADQLGAPLIDSEKRRDEKMNAFIEKFDPIPAPPPAPSP